MDDNITKTIKDKFDSLPESIQEIILSSHYQDTLIEIAKQDQLNVEQMGILERETTLVMMGLTPTQDFETELTRELKVDQLKGSRIVKNINEKIFLKIRTLLKLMNTPRGEKPSLEETEVKSNWRKNIDFILSGGDYFTFLEQQNKAGDIKTEETVLPAFSIKEENRKEKFDTQS